jgi:hypothetical protein
MYGSGKRVLRLECIFCIFVLFCGALIAAPILLLVAFGEFYVGIGTTTLEECYITHSTVQTLATESQQDDYQQITYSYRAYFEVTILWEDHNTTQRAAISGEVGGEWSSYKSEAEKDKDKHPVGTTTKCTVGENTIKYNKDDVTSEYDLIMFGDHVEEIKQAFWGCFISGIIILAIAILIPIICIIWYKFDCNQKMSYLPIYTRYTLTDSTADYGTLL